MNQKIQFQLMPPAKFLIKIGLRTINFPDFYLAKLAKCLDNLESTGFKFPRPESLLDEYTEYCLRLNRDSYKSLVLEVINKNYSEWINGGGYINNAPIFKYIFKYELLDSPCSSEEKEYIQDIYDKRLSNALDNFWGWYHPQPYTKYDKQIAHNWWASHPDERPSFNDAVKWGCH